MSPKRAPASRPGRDRFTAESYTVLGKKTQTLVTNSKAQQLCFFMGAYLCSQGSEPLILELGNIDASLRINLDVVVLMLLNLLCEDPGNPEPFVMFQL